MFIPRPFDTVTSLLVIIILMLGAEKKTIYSLYIHVFLCICHCNAIIVTFCLGGNPVVKIWCLDLSPRHPKVCGSDDDVHNG